MTNEQKLDALRQGLGGSYNLAPLDTSIAALTAFQLLACEARRLAADHGYFCRREIEVVQGGRFLRGVLVTIPGAADSEIPPPPRGAIESSPTNGQSSAASRRRANSIGTGSLTD